jgi:hypothetical protein
VDAEVKPKAWIVDIDGTVALKGERGPFDWGRVGEDEPNEPIIALVRALMRDGWEVRYVTGRMGQCRDETLAWLRKHVMSSTLPTDLYMREDDDYRRDEILKREIYETRIRGHFDVAGVIDDRAKVVRMWRDELGLTCLQVAEGDF